MDRNIKCVLWLVEFKSIKITRTTTICYKRIYPNCMYSSFFIFLIITIIKLAGISPLKCSRKWGPLWVIHYFLIRSASSQKMEDFWFPALSHREQNLHLMFSLDKNWKNLQKQQCPLKTTKTFRHMTFWSFPGHIQFLPHHPLKAEDLALLGTISIRNTTQKWRQSQ